MALRGRAFLIFALLSVACGRASKEATAPSQAEAGDALADKEAPAEASSPAPAPVTGNPSSTKDVEEGEGDSLSQAVSEFDRARRELSQLLGRDLEPPQAIAQESTAAGAPARDAPKSRSAPEDKAPSRAEAPAAAPKPQPLKKGEDGCVNVCRAFDSLARSAAAVCRLDEGERCRKANSVVSVAKSDASVIACACKK